MYCGPAESGGEDGEGLNRIMAYWWQAKIPHMLGDWELRVEDVVGAQVSKRWEYMDMGIFGDCSS